MTETFQIKTAGLKDGFSKDQVAYQLVVLFKRSLEDIQPMLDGKSVVIKKGVDLPTAIKYKSAIEQRGCMCAIEPYPQQTDDPHEKTIVPGVAADAVAGVAAINAQITEQSARPAKRGLSLQPLEEKKTPAEPEIASAQSAKILAPKEPEPTLTPTPTVSNEIGRTVNGDPFIVQTPQGFCCNCGSEDHISTIETGFVKHLVFSTRFDKEKTIALDLPYCAECADSVGKYPMSRALKWLLAICIWFAGFFLILVKTNLPQQNLFVRLLLVCLPLIPGVLVFNWIGRPKAPKTSACTPVKIREFSRNPHSVRNEGRAMLIVSAIAALLGKIFKKLNQDDPNKIRTISMKFSNPAYAKEFKKNNKSYIKDGFIKIL